MVAAADAVHPFYIFWRPAMLILTRRVGQTVKIGDDVDVVVLGVKGNQIRIGITAPKCIAVHREEIFERLSHARGRSAKVDIPPP